MKTNLLLALIIALIIPGCALSSGNKAVPGNVVKFGSFEGQFPKNFKAKTLIIDKAGSKVHMELHDAEITNDPEVISSAYTGQAGVIKAQTDAFRAGVDAAKVIAIEAAKAYTNR